MKHLAYAVVAILFSQNLFAETYAKGALLFKQGPVARCLVEMALPEFGPKLEVVDYLFQVSDDGKKILIDIATQNGFAERARFGIVVTTADTSGWQRTQVNEEFGFVAVKGVSQQVELVKFSSHDQSHSAIKNLEATACF